MNILIVVIASALFGIFPSIQENIMAAGVTPIALVTICNGIAGAVSFIICKAAHIPLKVDRKELLSLVLIGAIGLFATDYLLDISYTLIPVGYVTMIHFLYPALVCVAMALFFREKLTGKKICAVVLSIAGLALLAGSRFSGSALGIVTALVTAFAYAFYMIASDRTPAARVAPMARVFYTNLTVMVLSLFFWIPQHPVLPDTPSLWGQCAVVGVMLCTAIFLLNLGVKKIGAGTASFINMLEPVVSMVVSLLAFGYSLTAAAVIGCLLILGSMAIVSTGQKEKP